MWADALFLISILFAAPAMVLIGVYTPVFTFYAVKLARRRDLQMPRTFQNMWGLNRFGLLMYPGTLDEKAMEVHQKAMSAAKRLIAGVVFGLIALLLSGKI